VRAREVSRDLRAAVDSASLRLALPPARCRGDRRQMRSGFARPIAFGLWLTMALCAFVVGLLGGCSRSAPPGSSAASVILQRGVGPEPDSLDPQKARSAESQTILRDLCEGLTTLDRNAAPAPGIAREWTVSDDGKTYTFKLRPARWSSGDQVVAADFVA